MQPNQITPAIGKTGEKQEIILLAKILEELRKLNVNIKALSEQLTTP